MKNSKNGRAGVFFLVLLIILFIAAGVFGYIKYKNKPVIEDPQYRTEVIDKIRSYDSYVEGKIKKNNKVFKEVEFVNSKNYSEEAIDYKDLNEDGELRVIDNVVHFYFKQEYFSRDTGYVYTDVQIKDLGNVKAVLSDYTVDDNGMLYIYVLNDKEEVYRCTFEYIKGTEIVVAKLMTDPVISMGLFDSYGTNENEYLPSILIKTKPYYFTDYSVDPTYKPLSVVE